MQGFPHQIYEFDGARLATLLKSPHLKFFLCIWVVIITQTVCAKSINQ